MQYTIRDRDGAQVEVEGTNWVMAFAKAVDLLEIDLRSEPRLICTRNVDGVINIDGRIAGLYNIEPAQLDIEVRPSSRSKMEEIELPPVEIPTGQLGDAQPIAMPASRLAIEAPESLAERIFDLSMDLSSAEEGDAYNLALDLLLEFVPAEAGSVARGTLNDPCLTFVAARGPVASEIEGRQVAFGEGLVGMCFDVRSTIVVDDVDKETRHLDQFDNATGFRTVAALCVPILDEEQGLIFGVIQLLNPSGQGFTMAHKDAAELVANTLAANLGRR